MSTCRRYGTKLTILCFPYIYVHIASILRVVYFKHTELQSHEQATSSLPKENKIGMWTSMYFHSVCHACCVFSQREDNACRWNVVNNLQDVSFQKEFSDRSWSCNLNRCLRLDLEIYWYIYSKRNSKEIGAMLTSSRWHKKVKRLIKIYTRTMNVLLHMS